MNQLNDFDLGHLQNIFDSQSSAIRDHELLLNEENSSEFRGRILETLQYEAMTVGFTAIALGLPGDVVQNYLGNYLTRSSELLELQPVSLDATPILNLNALYVAMVLGDWNQASYLAKLKTYATGHYNNGVFEVEAVVMGYIVSLFDFVSEKYMEAKTNANANILQYRDQTQSFHLEYVLHTRLLVALMNRREKDFNSLLTQLLESHENQARNGRLSQEVGGLVCLPALGMSALAIKNRLEVQIENPYLPLDLLVI